MSTFDEKIKSDIPKTEVPSLEKLIKRNEQREKVDSKLKSGFTFFIRLLPLLMINILALFIIGLDNFLEGKWNWSIFSQASFWYSYFSFQTANWLVAISFLTSVIKKLKNNVKKYLENLDMIQSMVDSDHDSPFITKQAEIETLLRKKEMLEMSVYSQMHKLSVKHNIKSIEKFLRESDIKSLPYRKKRLYRRLHTLKLMLSDEWQRDYLKSHKVQYPRVTRSLLTSGFSPRIKDGQYNTYKTNVVSTASKMIAPNTITASLLGFILLSFQFIPKDANLTTWIKFAVQIFLIVWNTMTTMTLVHTIFVLTYLRSSEERSSDLKRLKNREANNNVGVPKVVMEIVNKPLSNLDTVDNETNYDKIIVDNT